MDEAAIVALPSSIILHLDLDCFYAAVEQVRLGIPRDQPLAVQQWEGLIAVNYAARAAGVLRHDRVSEAVRKCPDLHLVHVETVGSDQGLGAAASRDSTKVSLERYRQASRHVFEIFQQHADVCERASIDEAYLDVTRQVEMLVEEECDWDKELEHLVGTQRTTENMVGPGEKSCTIVESGPLKAFNTIDRRLLAGAIIANKIRKDIQTKLGYTCSVGIATNKLLAKIASARHKPDKQTIVPPRAVHDLMNTLPLKKIKLLGGKVGEALSEKWGCCTAGEAQKVPLESLVSCFGDRSGHYVFKAVRGIQEDKVQEKQIPKSMLAAKSFQATCDIEVVRKWLGVLAEELSFRMLRDAQENHRQPHTLQLYYRSGLPRHNGDHSKSCAMPHTVLHLLSSVCAYTSKVASEQSSSASTKAFQYLKSEAVVGKVFPSTDQHDFQKSDVKDNCAEENERVGSEGLMYGVDDAKEGPGKDLERLLHQASFQLFCRLENAFPCTRLALAASSFQDAPQGRQSIQRFFGHASQSINVSPMKSPAGLQEKESTDLPFRKPRGLLRYMSAGIDVNDSQALEHSSNIGDRKQDFQVKTDSESLEAEPFDSRGSTIQKKTVHEMPNPFFSIKKPASELEISRPCCQESLCQSEQASANIPVVDFSQLNSGIDTTTPGSGHLQNACEIRTRLADGEQQIDLTNIDVEEQYRIMNEIYGAQSDGERINSRQVAKQRKLSNPKPSQMSLSRYFHSH